MAKELELCPIHNCKPWMICPRFCNGTTHELVEKVLECRNICVPLYYIHDMYKASVVLDSTFPDAVFFLHCDFTTFCPECAKKNPFSGKHNKFGCGFTSQYSLAASKSNWNNACRRFARRQILNTLKGKTS